MLGKVKSWKRISSPVKESDFQLQIPRVILVMCFLDTENFPG